MQIHRKALFTAVCVFLLGGCAASSGAISDSDRNAMRSAVADFSSAMIRGDAAAAASHWAVDGTAMPPNLPTAHGRADIEKLFAGFGKITAFTQNVVEADGRGDLAYTQSTFEVTFVPPGATTPITDKGKGVLVWNKQSDGSWIVARGAWNSDLPLPK